MFQGQQQLVSPDGTGSLATYSSATTVDTSGPFFQSLGTNGRSCATCHVFSLGFSLTPAYVEQLFNVTKGQDPLFASVDGTNSPNAPVVKKKDRYAATSMLRTRGLIRVGLPIPANAEFVLAQVDDPYHFASAAQLSLFRRPLPTTNLAFLSGVMWDGRETFSGQSIVQDLGHQANDATLGHAEAAIPGLTADQEQQIVAFETSLFTAQVADNAAGDLTANGTTGGATNLSTQALYLGINDVLGKDPTGAAFNPSAMTLFNAWAGSSDGAKAAVARGEVLFNTRTFVVSNVKGLTDTLGVPQVTVTCTTCHDSPNVGNHSTALPLDIGLTDASRRTPDMPLYTLRNIATGETLQTTDPGRALITGKWKDIARFKGPILRGVTSRAPYFHNGLAANLGEVLDFYNTRFGANFTAAEKSDFIAFLQTL